jgi:hypothetical protein
MIEEGLSDDFSSQLIAELLPTDGLFFDDLEGN